MSLDYDEFIALVEGEGDVSREEADRAVQATLRTLAERLSGGEVADIARQLPQELRPWLSDGAKAEPFDQGVPRHGGAASEGLHGADCAPVRQVRGRLRGDLGRIRADERIDGANLTLTYARPPLSLRGSARARTGCGGRVATKLQQTVAAKRDETEWHETASGRREAEARTVRARARGSDGSKHDHCDDRCGKALSGVRHLCLCWFERGQRRVFEWHGPYGAMTCPAETMLVPITAGPMIVGPMTVEIWPVVGPTNARTAQTWGSAVPVAPCPSAVARAQGPNAPAPLPPN
jgi:Uncharacterized conserved protein (DUF2267)